MTTAVAELVEKALLLPSEERAELLEAIWEGESPSDDFINAQLSIVAERMENVKNGRSSLTSAADAHRMALESLRNES